MIIPLSLSTAQRQHPATLLGLFEFYFVGHAPVPVLSVLSFPTLILSAGVKNHGTLREIPPLTANAAHTSIPGIEDLSFTQGRTGREIECWLYQCMWTVSKVLRQLRATQRGFTRRGLGVKTEVS